MSFEKGSVSLRVFFTPTNEPIIANAVERFAKDAIPSMDGIPVEGCLGWATGRHLLDRNITEDSIKVAGHLRLTLVKADKKIPAALFKAECKQEELAVMVARGAPFLRRADKMDIAKSVKERMLPNMPPTLSGIDVVSTDGGCYATATSDSACDSFTASWVKATGQHLVPYTPTFASMRLAKVDCRTLESTSFSPDVENDQVEQDVGTEFLTWMWYYSEALGGMHEGFAFMLEGPFTFIHEGNGAHEIVIRRGNPGIASEAKSALMAGKKLKKAKMCVTKGDDVWSCSIDGQQWTFGSLKLPGGDATDPVDVFQERITSISTFVGFLESLFKKFIAIRNDSKTWAAETAGIREWVSQRATRV